MTLILIHATPLHEEMISGSDHDLLAESIGNYLNIAAFIYSLVCAELIASQLSKLSTVNSIIAYEAASLRKASLLLSMFPFHDENQHTTYIETLTILRNYALQSLWETMSFKMRIENISIIEKLNHLNDGFHPFATLPLVMSSIGREKGTESNINKNIQKLVGQYSEIVNEVSDYHESRLSKVRLKLPTFALFLIILLMFTMYFGFTFAETGSKTLTITLDVFINIGVCACIYFISDLDDVNNGFLRNDPKPLWLFLHDVTQLIEQAQEAAENGTEISNVADSIMGRGITMSEAAMGHSISTIADKYGIKKQPSNQDTLDGI